MTTLNTLTTSIHTKFNSTTLNNNLEATFYVLAGLGRGILILIFCIITICICFCLQLARRKRQVLIFTADNVYTREDDEQPRQGMVNK